MIASAILGSLLLVQGDGAINSGFELLDPRGGPTRLQVIVRDYKLPEPKISPKHRWQFEWLVGAYGQPKGSTRRELRFRVFSQERKEVADRAPKVARMLLRLWDFNERVYGLDHARRYNSGIVDVYLCWGGKAGGEQLFGHDREGDREREVNMIYFYDLASFTSPLEMAREVAHEYGHATLTPIGGYRGPDSWANGDLGERIFLRYLRDEIASGKLSSEDALDASLADLNAYVRSHVDPLVTEGATRLHSPMLLSGDGEESMREFLRLALTMNAVLPPAVYTRSMRVIGSTQAEDYPAAILLAVDETNGFRFQIPQRFKDKAIWLPTGKGSLTGAAVIKRERGWSLVKIGNGPVSYKPRA